MQRIIVCLKQAVDVAQIKTDPATGRLITIGTPRKISDFDKNALEEAVRIKEKLGCEVVALMASPEDAKNTLREALAIGADRAYLVNDPALQGVDTLATSFVLAEAVTRIGQFDLIICGEATIDSYSGQVGPRLAEKLGIPVVTYVRKLILEGDTVIAERSLEDCSEIVKGKMPILVTVIREINDPRIPTLMAVMKASKKELIVWSIEDLRIPKEKTSGMSSAIEILEVLAPKTERKRSKVEGKTAQEVAEKLVDALVKEGIVGR